MLLRAAYTHQCKRQHRECKVRGLLQLYLFCRHEVIFSMEFFSGRMGVWVDGISSRFAPAFLAACCRTRRTESQTRMDQALAAAAMTISIAARKNAGRNCTRRHGGRLEQSLLRFVNVRLRFRCSIWTRQPHLPRGIGRKHRYVFRKGFCDLPCRSKKSCPFSSR